MKTLIDEWLQVETPSPSPYVFVLFNLQDKCVIPDDLHRQISYEIIDSYRDLKFLKHTFYSRPQEELRQYIHNYVLPSNQNQLSKNVSQGDFGEIVAKIIVENLLGLEVPAKKLRWKLNKEKSLFCTDLLAHNTGQITNLYYFEIKSRLAVRKEYINGVPNYVTVNAHNSLVKDEQTPNEGIADFLSRYFYDRCDYDRSTAYSDIVINPTNYNRQFELFFVLEKSKYTPQILSDLENLPPTLAPLRVTILLVTGLGRLLVSIRRALIEEAIEYVYGDGHD